MMLNSLAFYIEMKPFCSGAPAGQKRLHTHQKKYPDQTATRKPEVQTTRVLASAMRSRLRFYVAD
ncbi:hypothetical protein [Andreprevotia sp. IGB-42]|uniref:hypothetical protein n=1 Tax=Andreprevotia sp. IGB-42 TaxID=2497473 RepID=UPI001357D758|nr:hypothetical protein [Andreprevotia sp. IGB-42]